MQPILNVIKLVSSTGLRFLKTFETDLFPLASHFDNVDVSMRRDVLATPPTDGMLFQLIAVVAIDKEPRGPFWSQLGCRVDFDHVIAPAISAPELFFVDKAHSESFAGVSIGSGATGRIQNQMSSATFGHRDADKRMTVSNRLDRLHRR
jgi:hypothetical protein